MLVPLSSGRWHWLPGVFFSPAKTPGPVASPAAPRMVGLQVGNVAPNFTLLTSDGKRIVLSNLRGQPVVLLFSSTGCLDCQTQVTDTQKVYAAQQAAHKPFALLAVDTQDTASYRNEPESPDLSKAGMNGFRFSVVQ